MVAIITVVMTIMLLLFIFLLFSQPIVVIVVIVDTIRQGLFRDVFFIFLFVGEVLHK